MPGGTLRGLGGDSGSVPSAGSRAPRCGAGQPPGSHPRGGGGRRRCRGRGRSWTLVSGTPPGWDGGDSRDTLPPARCVPVPRRSGVLVGCGDRGGAGGPLGPSPGPDPADPGLAPTGSHPSSLFSAAASESDPSSARPRATHSTQETPGSPPGAVTFRGQYTGGCQRRWGAGGGHPSAGVPGRAHAGFWQGRGTRRGCHASPRPPEQSRAPRGAPGVAGAGRRRVSGPGSSPQPLLAFPNAR